MGLFDLLRWDMARKHAHSSGLLTGPSALGLVSKLVCTAERCRARRCGIPARMTSRSVLPKFDNLAPDMFELALICAFLRFTAGNYFANLRF
jgi:hypothetical protein